MKRPEKITLGEMRAAGVRGLLIYCSDYKCSHSTAIGGGPMTFRCPILKRDLFAALAAPTAPMSGRISIGTRSSRAGRIVAERGWKRPFDDPIPLPRGRQIVTLEDAGDHTASAEREAAEWQAAWKP